MADKRPGRVRPYPHTQAVSDRWLPDKNKTLVALRGGWSAGHIHRQYGIPIYVTKVWREEAGITVPTKARPSPEVGQILE